MKQKRGFTLIEMLVVATIIGVGIIILVVALGLVVGAVATNTFGRLTPEDFSRIMAQEAIQNPVSTGYQYTGCGDGDTIHEGFTGVKNGIPVTGDLYDNAYKLPSDTRADALQGRHALIQHLSRPQEGPKIFDSWWAASHLQRTV